MANSICILGDSVARGVVLDSTAGKYVLLKDCFANRLKKDTGLEVKNLARFGSTVTKGAEILEKHADTLKNYDRVFLEFGGNDCDYDWAKIAADPDADYQPNTPLGVFVQKYTQMIREIRTCGSSPVLLSLPPIVGSRYFAWISRGLKAENILRWLGGDKDYIARWHEMYNLAVFRMAAETNTPVIDITSPFLEAIHYENLLCGDGIHPSALGHAQIFQTIDRAVRQHRRACAS